MPNGRNHREKTQGILKGLGGVKKVNIPTPGQVAEWIGRKIKQFLNKIYISPFRDPGVGFEDFIRSVESGRFYRKYFLGVSDKEQGFLIKDPVEAPGLICIGGQGSGKSTTMKGVLVTNQITSGTSSFYLLIDVSDKGMGDFNSLFDLPNVATALSDKQKLVPAITMAFDELERRGEAFRAIGSFENWRAVKNGESDVPEIRGAEKVYDYEEKYNVIHAEYQEIWQKLFSKVELEEREKERMEWIAEKDILNRGPVFCSNLLNAIRERSEDDIRAVEIEKDPKPVAFFYLVFEEFHTVPNSEEVNFAENHHTPGTLAYQLKMIARTGRSFGIQLMISTQRATYLEIPNDLKAGITNVLAHKVGNANDASQFNLGQAADILSSQRGRSVYEEGQIQFPYFSGNTMEKLLKKYPQEFNGFLFAHQPKDYKKTLKGSGSDGMVETSKLSFVVLNHQMFRPRKIVQRILKMFDFELLDKEFPAMEIDGLVEKNGKKYALLMIVPKKGRGGFSRGASISDKKVAHFRKEMDLVGADSVIVVSFDQVPSSVKRLADETGGYSADKEDLLKLAEIMDQKEESMANGTFGRLYNEIVFVRESEEEEAARTARKGARRDPVEDDEDFMSRFKLD